MVEDTSSASRSMVVFIGVHLVTMYRSVISIFHICTYSFKAYFYTTNVEESHYRRVHDGRNALKLYLDCRGWSR